jgi:hypothetical protein
VSSLASLAGPGRPGWRTLAVVAYLAELLLFTQARGYFGPYASPLLFYGSVVLMVVAALAALRDQPFLTEVPAQSMRRVGWGAVLAGLGTVLVLNRQIPIVLSQPIDIHASDIIPAMQVYAGRFLSGEVVYRYITTYHYPIFPVYLPAQWFPYTLALQWGIDFRWLSWGLLLLVGFGAYQLVLLRRPLAAGRYALLALLPGLVVWWMLHTDGYLFAQVLEPTIITYYFVLAASLFVRSAPLQAAAITLCVLSRYSLIFWVPFFLWLLWREVGWRYAFTVAGLVAAGIVGLYIVPFLSHDWDLFPRHTMAEYYIAAIAEWERSEQPNALPLHLANGLSASPWVFRLLDGFPLAVRVSWMQRLHAGASVGVVALLAFWYWRYGRRYDYRYVALLSLKLALGTFYFFIQVPYTYLISVSVLLSTFVLMVVLTRPVPVGTAPAAEASS